MTTLNKVLIGVGATAVVGGAAFIATRVIAKKKNQEEADKVAANPEMYEETPEQIQEMVNEANGKMDKQTKWAKIVTGVGAVLAVAGVVCNTIGKKNNDNDEIVDAIVDSNVCSWYCGKAVGVSAGTYGLMKDLANADEKSFSKAFNKMMENEENRELYTTIFSNGSEAYAKTAKLFKDVKLDANERKELVDGSGHFIEIYNNVKTCLKEGDVVCQ